LSAELDRFVAAAKTEALRHGFRWDPPHDPLGRIDREWRWDIGRAARAPYPAWLSNFGWGDNILGAAAKLTRPPQRIGDVLSLEWRDLYQATVIHLIFIQQQAAHSAYRMGTFIKVMALAAEGANPVDLTGDDVRRAYNVALQLADGEAARTFPGYVSKVFDEQHLAERPNLAAHCIALTTPEAQNAQRGVDLAKARANAKGYGANNRILDNLYERRSAMKLPHTRAFWEFCQIVFTAEPRSLHDLQLFAAGRAHVITGLRTAEITLLPQDWERWRDWVDVKGEPAGNRGGISRSLAIRHFAGKQGNRARTHTARQLVAKLQEVPSMFEQVIVDTLSEVKSANKPLRETYAAQIISKRLFSDISPGELISVFDAYARIYGNIQISSTPIPQDLLDAYRGTSVSQNGVRAHRFDPRVLDLIWEHQMGQIDDNEWRNTNINNKERSTLSRLMRSYWSDRRGKIQTSLFRDKEGCLLDLSHDTKWSEIYIGVADIEDELNRRNLARGLSAISFEISDGTTISPHEFLFLTGNDKGGVRTDNNVLDARMFYDVRRFQNQELVRALGGHRRTKHLSIFSRYSGSEEYADLDMTSHSIRHLQTTELFRKGISDAIITKRFGRSSVQQSHVYDHRSLLEYLAEISLPEGVEVALGPKASATYRLILSGQVSGPIVDRFRSIQRDEGDDAAFEFLMAEADGLHSTPYGFCLNSFTVDPCPKHLECFNGCLHLARSTLPGEQDRLSKLRGRTAAAVEKIEGTPAGSVGRENQLRHGRAMLQNIDKALGTAPGMKPFPEGKDLSAPIDKILAGTVLDHATPVSNGMPPALDMSDA
jgi:hypothetical protein